MSNRRWLEAAVFNSGKIPASASQERQDSARNPRIQETALSVVALSLPWLLDRFGIDPAYGSGPLATVIQDLLSVVIYLKIATAMLL